MNGETLPVKADPHLEIVRSPNNNLSTEGTLEDLYRRFYEKYRISREREEEVAKELEKNVWQWDLFKSFYQSRQSQQKAQSDSQGGITQYEEAPLSLFSRIERMMPQDAPKPKDLDELKQLYLRAKRLELLEECIANLRGSAEAIRQRLDDMLTKPIPFEIEVKEVRNLGEKGLTATYKGELSDDRAVLLTYIFTRKVPTSYHILQVDEYSPIGELLADAFGGEPRVLLPSYKRLDNYLRDESKSLSDRMGVLSEYIEHVVNSDCKVISTEGHIPIGCILGEQSDGLIKHKNSFYHGLVLTETGLKLAIMMPSEINSEKLQRRDYARTLLTPEELGTYFGRIAEPLHSAKRIALKIDMS